MAFFVYVLRSVPSGRLYIGMTGDLERRLQEHNSRNGRWSSRWKPWELLGYEVWGSRGEALARERHLKSRSGMQERRQWIRSLLERQAAG